MARFKEQERETQLDQNRLRILDAAANEFAQAGYLGANINTISTAAGFAKGTVYNYFPSKQALLLALVDSVAKMHLEFIRERVQAESDPAQRLIAFFQAGFEVVEQHYPGLRAMFNIVYGPEQEQRLYLYQAYQPLFQFFVTEVLTPGVQSGVFRPVELSSMTSLLMTIYMGTASVTTPDGKPLLHAQQIADLLLNGMKQ